MPELPEVETVRRGLAKRLLNFQIDKVEVCRERAISSVGGSYEFIKQMRGSFVGDWTRRGKYLLGNLHREKIDPKNTYNFPSEDIGVWGIHLRMTGHFQWHEKAMEPCRHTRVRFWNKEGIELRFVDTRSFGQMWWVPPNIPLQDVITGLKKLGPEPFSKEFNSSYLKEKLRGRTLTIKSALLNQSIVAGTGNIYADESLFEAGILPSKPAGELTQLELKCLCKSLIKTLKKSICAGGTTFSDFRDLEGLNGNYGNAAWVYRRTNLPCRKCNNLILKQKIGGRSTHWCSNCQN